MLDSYVNVTIKRRHHESKAVLLDDNTPSCTSVSLRQVPSVATKDIHCCENSYLSMSSFL